MVASRDQRERRVTRKNVRIDRPFFTPLRLVAFWLAAFAIYYTSPVSKAVAWLALDVPTLNAQIDAHMRSVHGDTDYACLYTITCASGRARLEPQAELTPAELVRVKNQVWRRLFDKECPAPTTNIGLEHSQTPRETPFGPSEPPRDCYSFGNGFGGASGIWSGCAFAAPSRTDTCTRDRAYWTREDGIVADKAVR
jgi:hypothetical protein